MSAGLIHDMRTPLNHIIGYSEILTEQVEEGGNDRLAIDLQKILNAGRQLLALVTENFEPASTGLSAVASTGVHLQNLPDGGITESSLANPSPGLMLVVDDIEENRDVLSRRLEMQGHTVISVSSGRQALEIVQTESFDVILLDIAMPEMDGFELLERLKADESVKHVPVIMVSASVGLESVIRCIEMGAEDYLPKPFNPTLLKARVGACLEKKRARDREMAFHTKLEENFEQLQTLEKLRGRPYPK